MDELVVLGLQSLTAEDAQLITSIDPRIRYVDACGWFEGEIRETWNPYAVARYVSDDAHGKGTRAERDALLAQADIVYGGWLYPLDLGKRATKIKWFHLRNAGASNLLAGDLWGSDIVVTTARGIGNTRAMSEYVLAGILHFSRGLYRADVDRSARQFSFRSYKPVLIAGKTVCVVGAGGIGMDVAKLCAAAGMRIVGTKRNPPASPPAPFAELGGPGDLNRLLETSDYVAVCCQWTPQTHHLFNAERFAAMKPGAVLLNVARGEIIDETALLDALSQDKLRGVALDVYDGEFEHNPLEALWADPRVLITPHISAGSDDPSRKSVDLFCKNLRNFIDGKPLENVLDWKRGY